MLLSSKVKMSGSSMKPPRNSVSPFLMGDLIDQGVDSSGVDFWFLDCSSLGVSLFLPLLLTERFDQHFPIPGAVMV
jgi:hypothetical protein